MIRIHNPGHLDPMAIQTFGISAKETDSPIGYFGTGMKYAIAVTLRLGGTVSILNNGQEITFRVARESFRNKDFDFIDMAITDDAGNDDIVRLPFTTELGKNWEPWQAVREFICNAIDENGYVLRNDQPAPSTGVLFIVDHAEYDALYEDDFRDIFLSAPANTARKLGCMEVYDRPSKYVFYRGVRILDLGKPSLRTYNITDGIVLTEDRTAKDPGRVFDCITANYTRNGTGGDAIFLCTAHESHFESTLSYNPFFDYGEKFIDGIRAHRKNGGAIPNDLFRALIKQLVKDVRCDIAALDDHDKAMLDKAIQTLNLAGYPITAPVHVVETLGPMVMGQVFDGEIYLSRTAFTMGLRQLMGTLFEEQLHIRENVYDCTRNMQNVLIDKLMGEYARKVGVVI